MEFNANYANRLSQMLYNKHSIKTITSKLDFYRMIHHLLFVYSVPGKC